MYGEVPLGQHLATVYAVKRDAALTAAGGRALVGKAIAANMLASPRRSERRAEQALVRYFFAIAAAVRLVTVRSARTERMENNLRVSALAREARLARRQQEMRVRERRTRG